MSCVSSPRVSTSSQLVRSAHPSSSSGPNVCHVSASGQLGVGGRGAEQLVTILPHLGAGDTSLLADVDIQHEDIRAETGGPGDLLVIQHGQTWVQDILGNIRVGAGFSDLYRE